METAVRSARPRKANRTARKDIDADGDWNSRGVGCNYQRPCRVGRRGQEEKPTSCIDWPRSRTMLWFAMIWGFLRSTAASVMWKSEMLRIIADAEMMAMVVVVAALAQYN
jgi:hypothetical protein